MKNYDFEAPGLLETGQATDFTTDLGVFQNGQEIARKTIRVNDPLAVDGYTFHQNGFGPAPDLLITGANGKPLWDGAVPLTDTAAGHPYGTMSVPGRDVGLELLLGQDADGVGNLLVLPYAVIGRNDDGTPKIQTLDASAFALRAGEASAPAGLDFSVGLRKFTRLHPDHRQEGPGPGDRLGGVRLPDRRDRDLVLPAAAPDLGPPGAATARCPSSPGPTGTWTSSGSSAGCSTTSSRAVGRPRRRRRRLPAAASAGLIDRRRGHLRGAPRGGPAEGAVAGRRSRSRRRRSVRTGAPAASASSPGSA